jgi:hypothetical protein
MPQRLPLLVRAPKILHKEPPSLRMSLQWSVGPKRCLRGSIEHALRSSPFSKLRVLSYVMPSSVLLEQNICLRGCRLLPSTILKWPGELTAFWAVVSSVVESVIGHYPSNTVHAEVESELVAEF